MRCIAPSCPTDARPPSRCCAKHDKAPPWQKAAWASVQQRARARAPVVGAIDVVAHEVYDASNVAPKLWIGATPPLDRSYPGIDMIVLCAAEYQPRSFPHFAGELVHCPLPDDALTQTQKGWMIMAARRTATALRKKKRVLVTCAQGRNRSALIAGLALGMITRASADQIIELIRQKRMATCLSNPHFCDYLRKFVVDRR